MKRPRTNFAFSGDISIAYQVFGNRPIDLVYAHGWVSNIEYAWESPHYAQFLSELSRFCRVIFFDRRGCGLSDREIGTPSVEQRTEDILTVMDAAGSDKAVIMGVSEGGNMAAAFAALYPERTRSLILYGSPAKGSWSPDYPWQIKESDLDSFISGIKENWGQPFEMDEAAPSMVDDPAASEWFAAYLRQSVTPKTFDQITRLNAHIDIRELLRTIRVPTCVIVRETDAWLSVEEAEFVARMIPDAELRVLPGRDHLPWYGDQTRLLGEIQEFITGHRQPSPSEHVLLTVMMSDIVGSTETVATRGNKEWQMLLLRHNAIIARRVAFYGGEVINTTGDGYLVTFSGPSRAIDCAKSIMSELMDIGIEVRIGIHTGECIRHDSDIIGMAVNITARILDDTGAGQIVVTSTVKDLTIGSLHICIEHETRQMKGVPGDWKLYLVAP